VAAKGTTGTESAMENKLTFAAIAGAGFHEAGGEGFDPMPS